MTAALLAYLPTRTLGLREGFWAAITALSVVQTEIAVARTTARDQIFGALIGAAAGTLVAATLGVGIGGYAIAISLAIVVSWLANIESAARLSAITATIILLVPHQGSVGHMVAARVGEVAWGVAAGLIVAWPFHRLQRKRADLRPQPAG